MKRLLFNLYFWPCFFAVTITGVMLVYPVTLLMKLAGSRGVGRFVRTAILVYGWIIIRVIAFMVPVRLHDRSGGFTSPVIFVSNHCSSIEPYLFALCRGQMAFVTTWPFNIPVYRVFMRLAQYIDAAEGWENVVNAGKKLVRQGCSLVVWPEGHRSRNGSLGRFRNGAFLLACEMDCPVIPVCMKGTDRVMPPGSRFLNPAPVDMVLLPPHKPDRDDDMIQCIYKLKHRVRDAINMELEGLSGIHL